MEDSDDDYSFVSVQGAGLEVVNGEYKRSGLFKGAPAYTKTGYWQGKNQEFVLFRYFSSKNAKHWYLSIFGTDPGTSNDTDFYFCETAEETPTYPPTQGWTTRKHGIAPAPTVSWQVIEKLPVAATYKGMLFCEDFSDVKLVCQDGVAIPAHKAVLAASSPYFKAAFTGPWKGNESGELSTTHPSHIIKAMLTMIYTGDIDRGLMNKEPFAFMSVASEYSLPGIKVVSSTYLYPLT